MNKISVIIPVYKAEKTIEKCARSLMEQTMQKDIEFIFVNDCTPDNTFVILRRIISEYTNRQSQVKIIENECNLGPSDSRKKAFLAASGTYIACCDADDWTEPEMYERMYEASCSGEKDIVVCNYRVEEGIKSRNTVFIPSTTPQDALSMMHERNYFPYAMWNQLIRRRHILNQIDKIVPVRIREDTYLMMLVYHYASSISFIPGIYYHYFYENENSLVHCYDDSYDAWIRQKKNMDIITKELYATPCGYDTYHLGLNYFKFTLKFCYRNAFSSIKSLYYEYRETHSDFIECDSKKYSSYLAKFKLKLIYDSSYIVFWLYNKLKS